MSINTSSTAPGAAAAAVQSPARPSGRLSWLPDFRPLQTISASELMMLEDQLNQRLALDQEPEEAEEVSEASDLDAAREDRLKPLAFTEPRHHEEIKGVPPENQSWRMRERMKTVGVALVVCLNVGVDPPDVVKTHPCAVTECWVDPTMLNPQRAIEAIGNNLQKQYERWQPRARYRQSLDPPLEEVRRLATGLRRNAREERVLFHYNGHGVPKPTANGEIWVFNRNYTQYIPLSLYDLQSWMGSPSIFVYDCSNAGIIVHAFEQFAKQHEREYLEQLHQQQQQGSAAVAQAGVEDGGGDVLGVAAPGAAGDGHNGIVGAAGCDGLQVLSPQAVPPPKPVSHRNCIQLAACALNQTLPMNPELPADLFSSCLTTPIKMALRWFILQKHAMLATDVSIELLDKIPGQISDRGTMLGELNWIFTAVTDTIAWNSLPRDVFQKLFRQDLLVASLFRNFLLAERVMRSYDCTPVSQPTLPNTHQHTMWKAWDLAVDMALAQLADIVDGEKRAAYESSSFFEEQLTAFEVWLRYGNEDRQPPEQLPIVLQVLLSQAHRLRALDLLGRFLDLGPWAVNLALSVGIFPYVLKLLQSSARELRPLLVSIWAKILAVDSSCNQELVRDASHKYFLQVLQDECMMPHHRTLSAFILATIVHNFTLGQQEAEQGNLVPICIEHLESDDPILRQWLVIALGRTWDKFEKARWRGARDNAHGHLFELLRDPVPEVRASAVFALGTFMNSVSERTEHANSIDHEITLNLLKHVGADDASPIVRRELVVALGVVVRVFEANFIAVCRIALEEEGGDGRRPGSGGPQALNTYATIGPGNAAHGGLKRILTSTGGLHDETGARQKLAPSTSSPSLDKIVGGGTGSIPLGSNGSSSSLLSLSSFNINSVYTKVWTVLVLLTRDPDPETKSLANALVSYLGAKAEEKARIPSILEGSPLTSKASFLIGTSPPPSLSSSSSRPRGAASEPPGSPVLQDRLSERRAASRKSTSAAAAAAASAASHPVHETMDPAGLFRMPPEVASPARVAFPDLSTQFLQWSSKYFTKQLMKNETKPGEDDHESQANWSKEWLYERNLLVRSYSEEQRHSLKTRVCKLDELQTSFKTSFMPQMMAFHPYNPQVAVAGQSMIDVRATESNATLCRINLRDWAGGGGGGGGGGSGGRGRADPSYTAMQYVNAHQQALLLTGADDGCIRVFIDNEDCTAKMVSAWQAMRESASRRKMCLAWEQRQMLVAVGGSGGLVLDPGSVAGGRSVAGAIDIWDCCQERKRASFGVGSDGGGSGSRGSMTGMAGDDSASFVSCLSFSPTNPALLGAGFSDGSTRLYDTRVGHGRTAPVHTFWEHKRGERVLRVQLQDSGGYVGHMVSGSSDGHVSIVDLRKATIARAPLDLRTQVSGVAIHRRAFVAAAWAATTQHVVVHSMLGEGPQLNVIKHQEGLLGGYKMGTAGCLEFHPHLLKLATGTTDGTVSIYNLRKCLT